jgi:hypothetical protein
MAMVMARRPEKDADECIRMMRTRTRMGMRMVQMDIMISRFEGLLTLRLMGGKEQVIS